MARSGRQDRGLAAYRLRNGAVRWQVRLWHQGRARKFSGFQTKTEARTFYEQVKADQRLARFFPAQYRQRAAQRLTLADLVTRVVEDYRRNYRKSLATAEQLVRFWTRWAGRSPVDEVTAETMTGWADQWLANGLTPATINRRMALLLRGYRLANQADPSLTLVPPRWRPLKEGAPRAGYLEWSEFSRLRAALPGYARIPATIAFWTGMRLGEILSLHWSHVQLDAERRIVSIQLSGAQTKTGQPRSVTMPGDLYETLSAWQRDTRQLVPACAWVCHRQGQRIRTLDTAWKSACVKVGLATGTWDRRQSSWREYHGPIFHDLRRTGVRNLVRAGVPEKVAMAISGHKTRSIFDRYNIVNEADLLEAGRRVVAYIMEDATAPPTAHSASVSIG